MKSSKSTHGFATVEAVLIIIVLGIVGFTGWFVYHAKLTTDKTLANTGNSSVPESKPKSTAATAATATPTTTQAAPTQQYLDFQEWGVKIPVSGQLATATYSDITQAYGFSVPTFQIRVTDPSIPSDQTCKGGVVAWIERVPNRSGAGYAEPHYVIGNYAYGYVYPQDCIASQSTGVMAQAVQAISHIVAAN